MLVVLIAATVSLSLMISRLFYHIAENYEIEWQGELSAMLPSETSVEK